MSCSFFAGLVGGAIGLGGAIILVPAWLSMNYDKDVAAASSGPLILISSFCSFFVSAVSGYYTLAEFGGYFVLAFAASWFVKELVNWLRNRFGLNAIIYMLLMFTMAVSLVVLLPYQYVKWR